MSTCARISSALALVVALGCGPAHPRERGPAPDVRLNEVDCERERVELVNMGDTAADLSDYELSDDLTDPSHRTRAQGMLAPYEHAVVELEGFKLRCADETVFLLAQGLERDRLRLVPGRAGTTVGRVPDGAGPFVSTVPTLGEPNRPFVDESAELFAATAPPVEIALEADPAALDTLNVLDAPYIHAQASVRVGERVVGPIEVGLRLKGRYGSFRTLDGKAAFKLDFAHYDEHQRLLGLEKLNLNNMVRDPSSIHEWLAYRLFASAGVPAPRTGFARVTLNGVDYGGYLALEAVDDAQFYARHFASTRALYEGEYGDDLFPGTVEEFDIDVAEGKDLAPLVALASALEGAPYGQLVARLEPQLDVHEALTAMAMELLIGHSDSYSLWRNNYFLHADDAQRVSLLPWGVDVVFKRELPFFWGRGRLLQRCLRDPSCLDEWLLALGRVARVARAALDDGLGEQAVALAELNARRFGDDPRAESPFAGSPAQARAAVQFLEGRVAALEAELACQGRPEEDRDGDGRRCGLDCDESSAQRSYGVRDLCGDGLDQNCDGFPDDDPSCDDCIEDPKLPGFLFCRTEKSQAQQLATCAKLDAELVALTSDEERTAVHERARFWFPGMSYWIGREHGPHAYTHYGKGEPHELPGPECVQAHFSTGDWVMNHCQAPWPAVCRRK